MNKKKTFDGIARKFKALLGADGVCAWGGARWAHARRGSAPCPSASIYRYLERQTWAAGKFPRESEVNTSRKCSDCMGLDAMVHPRHLKVYRNKWLQGNGGMRTRTRALVPGGGRVYGLYQCQNTGCYRTWSRDRNAFANIGRAFWERINGRERPATLRRAAAAAQIGEGPLE